MAMKLCWIAIAALLTSSSSVQGEAGYRRALLFGLGDVTKAVTDTGSNAVREVAQVRTTVASAGTNAVQSAPTWAGKAASGARDVAAVASSVRSGDNAGAVARTGSAIHAAGADNDCKDKTIASKLCNGAFGGAPGVNSVATDGVNYYTGKADARTAAEHAFQTVTDATVKSSGTELNRAGVNNDCKDNSGASQACRRLGGAQAVNGQISGGVQVAAAAVAGTYDSAGAKEFANNAAPAVVANTADAIKQAGIKNDCTGESAQSQACRAAGGAGAVNNAASTAVSQYVATAMGAKDGQQGGQANAGGCCCWDTSKNPGKPACSGSSGWCGNSGCN